MKIITNALKSIAIFTKPRLPNHLATIQQIHLEFVSYCNLRCKWCSLDHDKPKIVMSSDILEKFLNEITRDGYFVNLSELSLWNGGETLLHPELISMLKLISCFKQKQTAAKKRFPAVSLLSNGIALNKGIGKAICDVSIVDRMLFSVDGGSREAYELIRSGARWDRLVQNIRQFKKYSSGRPLIEIICMVPPDKPLETSWMTVEFRELIGLADRLWLRHPHDWDGAIDFSPDDIKGAPVPSVRGCRFLNHTLVLLPNGDVTVCCADLNGRGVIGNLNNKSLKQIYTARKRLNMVRLYSIGRQADISLCRKCRGY